MARIIWIIVLFLAFPAGIYFLLDNALSTQESEWSQEVLKDLPVEKQQEFSLSKVCYSSELAKKTDLSPVCRPYKNTRHLKILAVGTAAIPVLYSLLLTAISLRCRRERDLLLYVFRPGIYVSTILVAILLLLQWLLLSGVIYGNAFGQMKEEDYVWVLLLGSVAVTGAFFTIRPLLFGLSRAKTEVLGLALTEQEYPQIWKFVRGLAGKADAPPPDHLVAGFTPNFFVTEATVDSLSGTLEGATMYLSLPLCRIMSLEELAAVVLHELAHFKGEDAKFSIHFYPIYRGVSDSAQGVANASAQFAKVGSHIPIAAFKMLFLFASLFLLPSVYLLTFFLDAFSRAENHIGRDRELAADGLAAELQGAAPMASVLVKLAAFSSSWYDVTNWAQRSYSEGVVRLGDDTYQPERFFLNMSEVFSAVVQNRSRPERLENLDSVKLPHPTDTHPPLSIRLNALKTPLASTSRNALCVEYEEPSSSLIDNIEALEINLSNIQRKLFAV
jgi:Zn-dependent protease with chaperone function